MPKYADKAATARRFGVTERTILNWLNAGNVVGYRQPGTRTLVFDLDEVAHAIEVTESMRPASKHFSPNARIVDLPAPVRTVIVAETTRSSS
jgi:hypothetical protein